jgi:hypothetical protein
VGFDVVLRQFGSDGEEQRAIDEGEGFEEPEVAALLAGDIVLLEECGEGFSPQDMDVNAIGHRARLLRYGGFGGYHGHASPTEAVSGCG